ncbi:MAG: Rieske (2Fe-2S) protein [Myxococcota bacterium]|nr:Rieske (2Fe-2S) protein [Myxococcota bacterium]
MSPGLHRVATLTRTIRASLERVWENVYDWEHLPWLHRQDFASIDLIDSGAWGWKARAVSTALPDAPFTVALMVETEANRYVSRTLQGDTTTAEIWTALDPVGEDETAIQVEFWLADIPESARESVGSQYRKLYGRLWDQDEEMMRERARHLRDSGAQATDRVLDLGFFSDVSRQLPLCVDLGGARWRLVSLDGDWVVHDTRCPHALGPLSEGPDASGELECPWHGYRFDVRTSRSCDGRRLQLRKPPRVVRDRKTDRITLTLD